MKFLHMYNDRFNWPNAVKKVYIGAKASQNHPTITTKIIMKLDPIGLADTRIAVGAHGAGPAVMLIAGLGGRAAFWSSQVHALKTDFKLILHDHRGTGASARDLCRYSISQMATDALAVLDHFAVDKAHIVGHSTGGAIAQYLALHHPNRVNKVVISASWCGPNAYLQALFKLRREILLELGPEAYLTDGQLRGFPAHIMLEKAGSIEADKKARLAQFPGPDIEQRRMDAILEHDLREKLPEIAAETLVICAADDQITPLPLSEECASLISGAQLKVLPTGGHFAPQAVPQLYTPAIQHFLQ